MRDGGGGLLELPTKTKKEKKIFAYKISYYIFIMVDYYIIIRLMLLTFPILYTVIVHGWRRRRDKELPF